MNIYAHKCFKQKYTRSFKTKKFLANADTDGNVFTAEAEGHDIWRP